MPKSIDFDINKFLDSLTIEELRSFAKVGVGVTCDVLSVSIHSLMKFLGGNYEKAH